MCFFAICVCYQLTVCTTTLLTVKLYSNFFLSVAVNSEFFACNCKSVAADVVDVNECETLDKPCPGYRNNMTCNNTPGSFTCSCSPGFRFNPRSRHCEGNQFHSLFNITSVRPRLLTDLEFKERKQIAVS